MSTAAGSLAFMNGPRLTALVVDDELPALSELSWLLEQDERIGEVVTANSGTAALGVLEARGYHGISGAFEIAHVDTPATWAAQGMGAGSPFAAAHTFPQTGPFRRRNLVAGLANVVLAGSGTTPGVGVPTALLSGRLAAARITGPGVDSRRTAEPPAGSGTLDNRSRPPRRSTRPRPALGEQNP